jgi:hypothetical protein
MSLMGSRPQWTGKIKFPRFFMTLEQYDESLRFSALMLPTRRPIKGHVVALGSSSKGDLDMRKLLIASIAALSVSVAAAEPKQMTVTGSAAPTLEQWSNDAGEAIGESIDRELRFAGMRGAATGITYVGFECSEDGTPINIRTTERGGRLIDRTGLRVVERLNLHPVFRGHKEGQQFEAAILIAKDNRDLVRGQRVINERVRKSRDAWAAKGIPNPVVALGTVMIR